MNTLTAAMRVSLPLPFRSGEANAAAWCNNNIPAGSSCSRCRDRRTRAARRRREFTAVGAEAAAWSPEGDGTLRYLSAIHVQGGTRLYYEASRADGAHELRTEFFSDRG
jgi:hypothetical protein